MVSLSLKLRCPATETGPSPKCKNRPAVDHRNLLCLQNLLPLKYTVFNLCISVIEAIDIV